MTKYGILIRFNEFLETKRKLKFINDNFQLINNHINTNERFGEKSNFKIIFHVLFAVHLNGQWSMFLSKMNRQLDEVKKK